MENINSVKCRIQKLISRDPSRNAAIIKKLQRKLRHLEAQESKI